MILAAGRGERMRPLTDTCPKPLLPVAGKPLIVWHLERLAAAGLHEIVINHAHLGHMIEETLGDGQRYGVQIQYSAEASALETAGGIAHALPLLRSSSHPARQDQAPFLVINGDIFCDFNFSRVQQLADTLKAEQALAWLLLAPNPPQHPHGDFHLLGNRVDPLRGQRLTFSGIGLYHPALFTSVADHQPAKLAPLLQNAINAHKVIGQCHNGRWVDVGTPERLAQLTRLIENAVDASPESGGRKAC